MRVKLLMKVQVTHVWECTWEARRFQGESGGAIRRFLPSPIDGTAHPRCHAERQDFDRQILPARDRAKKTFICVFPSHSCRHHGHERERNRHPYVAAIHDLSLNIYNTLKSILLSRRFLKKVSGSLLSASRKIQTLLSTGKNQNNRLNKLERRIEQR